MKTEDEILAQLRASQNINLQNIPLPREPGPPIPPLPKDDVFPPNVGMTPNLEDLQKLIQEDTLKDATSAIEGSTESPEHQVNYTEYILPCPVSAIGSPWSSFLAYSFATFTNTTTPFCARSDYIYLFV